MTRGIRTFKTVVADSHNLFRRGLATLIAAESDMEVVGEAVNAAQALALLAAAKADGVETSQADVLVMEIGLIREDQEAIIALRAFSESTALLLLAPAESAECLELTIASGARAYMLKSSSPSQLVAGIRQSVFAGRRRRTIAPGTRLASFGPD